MAYCILVVKNILSALLNVFHIKWMKQCQWSMQDNCYPSFWTCTYQTIFFVLIFFAGKIQQYCVALIVKLYITIMYSMTSSFVTIQFFPATCVWDVKVTSIYIYRLFSIQGCYVPLFYYRYASIYEKLHQGLYALY